MRQNSIVDHHLGLHLITSVCSPGDRAPLSTDEGALDNLVRRTLTLFAQVFLRSFYLFYLSLYLLTLVFISDVPSAALYGRGHNEPY